MSDLDGPVYSPLQILRKIREEERRSIAAVNVGSPENPRIMVGPSPLAGAYRAFWLKQQMERMVGRTFTAIAGENIGSPERPYVPVYVDSDGKAYETRPLYSSNVAVDHDVALAVAADRAADEPTVITKTP